jgi:nicotinamide-nucleotide amidase
MDEQALGRWQVAVDEAALSLGRLLAESGAKVVTVESCTGGLIARALTEAAGSSAWFDRGFVTYSNEAKRQAVQVAAATLEAHGAVSEAVAAEMASGGLDAAGGGATPGEGAAASEGATPGPLGWIALSVTGIAGPTGGVPGKPVGTVCFGWALQGPRSGGRLVRSATRRFDGNRAEVRLQAALEALREAERLWRGELADRPPVA